MDKGQIHERDGIGTKGAGDLRGDKSGYQQTSRGAQDGREEIPPGQGRYGMNQMAMFHPSGFLGTINMFYA
jgi:hypothetical protein